MDNDIRTNDSASHAPPEIKKWADKITTAQGCPGLLTREASGYHLYIPCPDCLGTHGAAEMADPKYSINLSMLACIGDEHRGTEKDIFSPMATQRRFDEEKKRDIRSSICMRTRSSREPHRHSIGDLINMSTITERFPDIMTRASLSGGGGSAEREAHWEVDPISGINGPPPAGELLPIESLPAGHPAVAYLTNRNYDIADLAAQFRCSFCVKEYPYGEKGIYYRKMPGGWMDSPQHRIIFHSLIGGAPLTWQARVIERSDTVTKFMLHPYAGGYFATKDEDKIRRSLIRFEGVVDIVDDPERGGSWGFVWSRTHSRSNPKSAWIPIAPFDEAKDGILKFRPSKYRTAKYSSRQMMGWDAAIARANDDPETYKWVILTEGPLDAARVGPGGVALLGSSISDDNAAKISSNFHIAFSGFDADKAGRQATSKINKKLMSTKQRSPILQGVLPMSIPSGLDLGDMSPEQFQQMLAKTIKKFKRGM